jgi:hypothetical protein
VWSSNAGGGLFLPSSRRPVKEKNQPHKFFMTIAAPFKTIEKPARNQRRSIADLLAPLEKIAATSPNLVANHDAKFEVNGEITNCRAICSSDQKAATRRSASAFLRASTATNRKARTPSSSS